MAQVLAQHPELGRVRVEGHTDDRGKADYNRRLSQARAEAIRQYLIERGVPGERLEAAGFGKDRPVADNGTEAGRAKNRRVEFKLVSRE